MYFLPFIERNNIWTKMLYKKSHLIEQTFEGWKLFEIKYSYLSIAANKSEIG